MKMYLKWAFSVLCILSFQNVASANETLSEFASTCRQLQKAPLKQLDETYSNAEVKQIPIGSYAGCIIGFRPLAIPYKILKLLAQLWRGKTFYADQTLANNILGFKIVRAQVYYGISQFDANNAIVIDYSGEIFPINLVRDEIREVSPGLYLGRAYLKTIFGNVQIADFSLSIY